MQEHIRIKNNKFKLPSSGAKLPSRNNKQTHPLLKVQESLGNRAMLHLRGRLGTLQAKLSLGQPHDIYEQEADTVARQIVNQISQNNASRASQNSPVQMVQKQEDEETVDLCSSTEDIQRQVEDEEQEELPVQARLSEQVQRQEEDEELPVRPRLSDNIQRQDQLEDEIAAKLSDDIQRQVEPEEEEEEEEEIPQAKSNEANQPTGELSTGLENQVQQQRQGGELMDAYTRQQMETGFGYDFSQVHIHNDSVSDQISRQLNAEAFTLKGDIFFRNGRYNPGSTSGQDLLAHELTHVVQQGAASRHDSQSVEPI
jgi:hypothetical protein